MEKGEQFILNKIQLCSRQREAYVSARTCNINWSQIHRTHMSAELLEPFKPHYNKLYTDEVKQVVNSRYLSLIAPFHRDKVDQ